jgi:hypothetical protein
MIRTMTRERIDIENLLFDHDEKYLTASEEKRHSNAANTLAHNPDMLITVYEMPEKLAAVIAYAIETGSIDRLSALITWDIQNYLDENGGLDEWLS